MFLSAVCLLYTAVCVLFVSCMFTLNCCLISLGSYLFWLVSCLFTLIIWLFTLYRIWKPSQTIQQHSQIYHRSYHFEDQCGGIGRRTRQFGCVTHDWWPIWKLFWGCQRRDSGKYRGRHPGSGHWQGGQKQRKSHCGQKTTSQSRGFFTKWVRQKTTENPEKIQLTCDRFWGKN